MPAFAQQALAVGRLRHRRQITFDHIAGAGAAIASGQGYGYDDSGTTSTESTATTPTTTSPKGTTVKLGHSRLGTYLVSANGLALYLFAKDTGRTSKCTGACAKAWPPLLIKSPGKIYPKGIDPKILGYVERADGHCQVTTRSSFG